MLLHSKYIEKVNEEEQGKELYFEEIPTTEERQQLKQNGYKWNNQKKCWYIKLGVKQPTKIKCKIDLKGLNLREFTELTEEEKEKFVNDVWSWSGEKWKNEQLKKHYFFKTKDNFIIAVENEKYLSISKDLWFDDEQPIPNKTKALFINYNERHCNDYEENNTYIFIQNYYNKFPEVVAIKCIKYLSDLDFEKKQNYYKRELTEAEKIEIIKIKKLIKIKYIERLDKYFDKYGEKNVFCRGYWVNR